MFKEIKLMSDKKKNTVLFYPYISKNASKLIVNRLKTRWIGQGPVVDKFEKLFEKLFLNKAKCISTGSGTDALHLAYILADIKKGDEVIVPVFTCTATNIPLLYMGAKIKFADINPATMNISLKSIKKLISKKTKAIVCVHYGGNCCEMDEISKIAKKYNAKVIEDAAQAIGAEYNNVKIGNISDFTAFSFQAIKHITTGDGGMLAMKNTKLIEKAKRLRWFGIDRKKKQLGTWENDIYEVGYKYQLTDLGAAVGLEGLKDFKRILNHRRKIYNYYLKRFENNKSIKPMHDYSKKNKTAAWIFTISSNLKDKIQKKLKSYNIESNQVHFRNDKYSIFKSFARNQRFKNMDFLENKYLVLPLHTKISLKDAKKIADIVCSVK